MNKRLAMLRQLYDKDAPESKNSIIHIPDIVHLLQGLGFYINRIDGCQSDDTHLLKENRKGIRIIMTCNHSGQRYYLEQPTETCNCKKTDKEELEETFWEISGLQPSSSQNFSFIDSGCNLIPPISGAMKNIISKVLSDLNQLILEDQKRLSSTENKRRSVTGRSRSASLLNETYDSFGGSMIGNIQTRADFTTKCRSLEGLTKEITDTSSPKPEIAILTSSRRESQSSVFTLGDDFDFITTDNKPPGDATNVLALLRHASEDLLRAMPFVENLLDRNISTPQRLNIEKLKELPSTPPPPTRSVSSPNFSKPKQMIPTIKLQHNPSRALRKLSSSSLKSTKSDGKPEIKPGPSNVKGVKTATKSAEKVETQRRPVKRTASLYAHIKSTIPKPSPKKK